jgi:hypothetical protein
MNAAPTNRADPRDLLQVLKDELTFLESGGYQRTGKAWRPTLLFEDSESCVNYGDPFRSRPCTECILTRMAPREKREGPTPCRHIPLDKKAQTLDLLYRYADGAEIEEIYRKWLVATIQQIESDRHRKPYSEAT